MVLKGGESVRPQAELAREACRGFPLVYDILVIKLFLELAFW